MVGLLAEPLGFNLDGLEERLLATDEERLTAFSLPITFSLFLTCFDNSLKCLSRPMFAYGKGAVAKVAGMQCSLDVA